ncbi:DUF7115 domain-containing protein [Haladaptatus sp. CMSO5]|uniref:DUF7115 domain-containing protein n=1 Tax=Haladaptatus sp. CMSO5 TaxID=3120514 RepID=UPI002FCE5A9C
MNLPDLVNQHLGDEQAAASVHLGGDDRVYITPTRTLVYRAEGLLSDETVEEFSHNVERLSIASGRRKDKFELEYIDGKETFTVPGKRTDDILQSLMAGILSVSGVMDGDETLAAVYRFSELTFVVTSKRVVKHVGQAVWDADFEEYPFADITGLSFEDGSVATSIVIERNGRPERIKCPNEQARVVRQTLEKELFDFYDVASLAEFNTVVAPDEEEDAETERADTNFEQSGLKPLGSGSASQSPPDPTPDPTPEESQATNGTTATSMFEETEAEPIQEPAAAPTEVASADSADVQAQLADLTAVVEQQSALLEQQQVLLEQLIDELSRGR